MNFNNYTIKSQETIQQAQQLVQELSHGQIVNPKENKQFN